MKLKHKCSFIIFLSSFVVYTLILLWGLLENHHGDYYGYAMLSFYIYLPATSFIGALILNVKNALLKWVYPFLFGILGSIIPMVVFPSIEWALDVIPILLIAPLAGMSIGFLIRRFHKKSA